VVQGRLLAHFVLESSWFTLARSRFGKACKAPMESPAILSQGLPLAQAAALLYADGRASDAEHTLLQALESDTDATQAWEMLFDLHRTRGDWRAFEQSAERFARRYGRPAPQWLDEDALRRLPAELRPSGDAYFELAGMLDPGQTALLDRIRAAGAVHTALHLDLSKLQAAVPDGCGALLATLRGLTQQGNGVLLTGAERVAGLLRETASSGGEAAECFALALELYRLRGRKTEFERAALEYALAAGGTPPEWQPALMPVVAPQSPLEKRDQPRYQRGPEVICLSGTLAGTADPQIGDLRQFAADRRYVNIDLRELDRMDLSGSTAFVETVNEHAAAGKTVRLLRPNSLVRALLSSCSLDPRIVLPGSKPI
jgi:ABC-type transporter Mla MlaB component